MTELDFSGTSYDTLTQHKMIKDLLHEGVFLVEFTKVNGELRTMPCTLHKDWMPSEAIKEHHSTRPFDPETISAWCTDKQAWRAFKTMRVISIKPKANDE
jgi:hypothetical protein